MNKIVIEESDMKFGEYNPDKIFHIEECSQYTKELKYTGVQICEFVLLHKDKLLIIEAKKTCPNHDNAKESIKKFDKYNEYIESIAMKFRSSLNLYASILLGRYEKGELENKKEMLRFSDREIVFVLVVKNAELDWLSHYNNKFNQILSQELKIYRAKLIVINEEVARKKNLIL